MLPEQPSASGRRSNGLTYLGPPRFTADGRYYVYSYNRQISERFVAEDTR
jgi:hypothetical protein